MVRPWSLVTVAIPFLLGTKRNSIVVVVVLVSGLVRVILANGNLNTLARKAFAQGGTLANPREFLGGVNLEHITEDRRENRGPPNVDGAVAGLARGTNVHK